MATFKTRDGRELATTAKNFVKSYHKDAECGARAKGYIVQGLPLNWKRLHGVEGDTLGIGDTPQKAWLDAARKLESRLQAGGYQ